ncbi:hypothetical protein B0T18DRAFT_440800 [Schizothecium vesticola]|uniref:6-methylsalicylate decarboxylase n=1 Tax=Schizothecium vesticola TaxID=314040 RepID=A0AA40EGN1_9PEZI|nr:hypothetical protein B0T18DRAFT_440800 [Schizothecium vesticola]
MAGLQNYAQQWYMDKALTWPSQPPVNKIDLHHHFIPDFYARAIEDAGNPTGWPTPRWSPSSSRMIMKHLGVQSAILSVTAPGPCVVTDPDAQASLARQLNEYAAHIRNDDHHAFGFFASLPDITNTSAALVEIEHAFDTLGADGVVLYTRYGPNATYLGHPSLDPIWAELDRRAATVLVHPTHPVDRTPISADIPQPLIDYPHETTRTAVDLITARTLLRYPDVKVILSHAGGTFPYLAGRLVTVRKATMGWSGFGRGEDETAQALKRFYYDIALSTAPAVLKALVEVAGEDHIVYGSDFPYAPSQTYPSFLSDLETFDFSQEARDRVNFANAQALIPRLGKQIELTGVPAV